MMDKTNIQIKNKNKVRLNPQFKEKIMKCPKL